MNNDVLTIREVSRKLRISKPTTTHLLQRGLLRGVKAGRQWRISSAAIDDFLRGDVTKKQVA